LRINRHAEAGLRVLMLTESSLIHCPVNNHFIARSQFSHPYTPLYGHSEVHLVSVAHEGFEGLALLTVADEDQPAGGDQGHADSDRLVHRRSYLSEGGKEGICRLWVL
jgi:hypothetical protein